MGCENSPEEAELAALTSRDRGLRTSALAPRPPARRQGLNSYPACLAHGAVPAGSRQICGIARDACPAGCAQAVAAQTAPVRAREIGRISASDGPDDFAADLAAGGRGHPVKRRRGNLNARNSDFDYFDRASLHLPSFQ